MLTLVSKYWWAFALRGILALIFGLLALFSPVVTLGALIIVFGIYALFDGVLLIFASFRRRSTPHWWATLIEGIVGIIAGIVTFTWPALTALVLLAIIAGWALITGIFEIVGAIRLRKEIKGEWFYILSGLVSVVFAIFLLSNPFAGALALVWVIGIYAIVFGLLLIALGFRVHRVTRI